VPCPLETAAVAYLDYAASAPLHPRLRSVLSGLWAQEWGNASSLHSHGRRARMVLEDARERVAASLGAKVEEIVFTSGATEANNLAVLGWMRTQERGSHCLVSAVEHPSVWEAAELLRAEGYEVDTVPVDGHGRLRLDALQRLLRPETRLVSVMAVNNEIGVVQPLDEVLALKTGWKLHVDAVQSAWTGWPKLDGIDFLSVSAHKLGGPVGSGCLFLRQGLRVYPLLHGGAQEDHRRAGTSNPLAALALAEALELQAGLDAHALVLGQLQAELENALAGIPGALLLGAGAPRSPHISSWVFAGAFAEPLLVLLDLEGISASSGSACSSHSIEPSRVVLGLGRTAEEARGLVRFSFGYATTAAETRRLATLLPALVARVRGASTLPL
jgi:cysteine desulfurase